MTQLIAMCGLSFSGKTTLARQIARHTGARYVSLDAINEERDLCGGQGIPPEEWEKTSAIAIERASAALKSGVHVVLDDTLCFRWLRDRYAAVAERLGAEFVLVHVDTPISQIYDAMRENQSVRTRQPIRPEVFQQHMQTFERPAPEERPVVFDRTEPIEVWLERFKRSGL